MTHAWCRDTERDEAVRAVEDNRQGPLPTLEEAIARAGQFMPPQAPQEQNCTEQDNKGDDMRPPTTKTATVENDFAKPAKGSPALSESGEGQSGMRTERITLEVTHNNPWDINHWAWDYMLRLGKRESVRVVDEVHFDDLANMSLERDAAIRERDELRVKRKELQTGCNRLNAQLAKKDAPYKTALDAAIKGMERAQRERDDAISEYHSVAAERDAAEAANASWCKAAGIMNARVAELESHLESAPAASGAAVLGWLTAEEREAVLWLAEFAGQRCGLPWPCGMGGSFPVVAHRLLARSSPPEVVLEDFTPDAVRNLDTKYLAGWDQCMALAKRAIIAAGVTVKEVGK